MKNYYFKVFLVAICALIFSSFFGVNSFAGFFLEGEYHNDPIPMSSLMNETSWDSMQGYVSDVWGIDFPTWSQASAVDDVLEDIAMFYVGQTVSLSETVASNVANAILDSTSTVYDIWDIIAFDGDTGEFVCSPNYTDNDLSNIIHGYVDPLIYYPGGYPGTIDKWVALPYTASNNYTALSHGHVTYACKAKNGGGNAVLYATFESNSYNVVVAYPNGNAYQTYIINTPYEGTVNSGLYVQTNGIAIGGGWSSDYYYTAADSGTDYCIPYALEQLFGAQVSENPELNGEGIIINDNPNYKPVTAYSVLNYDYSTYIVNNYNTGEPVTWPVGVNTVRPYTYDYNGIYWDAPELDTLLYPVEYEFPSLEFETIEVDPNVDNAIEYLEGSWIVEFLLIAILLLIVGLIL